MQRACCFSEMAVLRGMICFRRNDAGADRIPNNNHLAMNISPGRVVARMTISQVSDLAHKDISHFVRFIFFFSSGTIQAGSERPHAYCLYILVLIYLIEWFLDKIVLNQVFPLQKK